MLSTNFKSIILTLILLFIFGSQQTGFAQPPTIASYNTEAYWQGFHLLSSGGNLDNLPQDKVVIMASNRRFQKDSLRFLTDQSENNIRYFLVWERQQQRLVLPVKDLKTAIHSIPNKDKDWVIYTEGMGKLFTSAADRALRMQAQYDVNVIMLDYPSISSRHKRLGNYYFAKREAAHAHQAFAPVLDTLKNMKKGRQLGNGSLNLFFHSMGNIVMETLVKKHRLSAINNITWVDNLLLNAACVPQYRHRKWVEKIKFSKQIYVLYNPKDYTLGGAYLLSKKQLLGKKVHRPLAKNAQYINVESIVGKGHSYFLHLQGMPPQPKELSTLYQTVFHGSPLLLTDKQRFGVSSFRHIGWEILPLTSRLN